MFEGAWCIVCFQTVDLILVVVVVVVVVVGNCMHMYSYTCVFNI